MPPEFEQLIYENNPRIRRIAKRYATQNGADDLYQEILIQLWRSLKSFKGESKIETWIYRVALNTAMAHARVSSKKRITENNFTESNLTDEVNEIAVPTERCQADILTQFLNSLNEIDASTLMMHLDGLTPTEIAEVLGVSLNAVNIRINRIKQNFSDTYID